MARITEYFSRLLKEVGNNAWVRNEDITFREIGENEGYIRGVLDLQNGYQLHIAEYVIVEMANPDGLVKSRKTNLQSFPRRRESSFYKYLWIPVFTGMTENGLFTRPSILSL